MVFLDYHHCCDYTVMAGISYISLDCTHEDCQTQNLVRLGNLEDQSAPDVEAFKCCVCGHLSWMVLDEFERKCMGLEDITDANAEDGMVWPHG